MFQNIQTWSQRWATLWSRHARYFQVAILAIVAGLGIAVWLLHDSLTSLDVVGYPGVFFFSFLGSSAMVCSTPRNTVGLRCVTLTLTANHRLSGRRRGNLRRNWRVLGRLRWPDLPSKKTISRQSQRLDGTARYHCIVPGISNPKPLF